jgi:tRNA A-37 threonylcarbamoyl transferase component Bud32
MAWRRAPAPPGYTREWLDGDRELVVLRTAIAPVREAMRDGTLYDFAAHAPGPRAMRGRGTAYAVELPDGGPRVVIRHSRHGGLLAGITGDRFVAPTRAPRELRTVLRLTRLGVPTPELVAYATYPAGGVLRRADIATKEIAGGRDLGALLADTAPGTEREASWRAVARLVARMSDAGVRHPDLNAGNVLLAPDDNGDVDAWLLDVDRVWFDRAGEPRVLDANLRRLLRSARKWRDHRGAQVDEAELHALARDARDAAA